MDKNKIMALAVAIVLIVAGFFIFYDKNQNDINTANQNETAGLKLNNQKMNKQGVEIEILNEGAGIAAKNGNTVSVHYTGTLDNGTKFDSSVDRGVPFEFTLGAGQVIPGWDIGVEGMKVDEKRKLTIPSELAYGERGVPGAIPPGATLIFEVELFAIK